MACWPKAKPTSPISFVPFSPSVLNIWSSSEEDISVSAWSIAYSSFRSCHVSPQFAQLSGIPTDSTLPSAFAFSMISSSVKAFRSTAPSSAAAVVSPAFVSAAFVSFLSLPPQPASVRHIAAVSATANVFLVILFIVSPPSLWDIPYTPTINYKKSRKEHICDIFSPTLLSKLF